MSDTDKRFSGAGDLGTITVAGREVAYRDLASLCDGVAAFLARLPYCLRVLLENTARNAGPGWASREEVDRLAAWRPGETPFAVPIKVSRVILPDSSGLNVLMDLAALRGALIRAGHDARLVQPSVPVDLVVDHSVMVDHFGSRNALSLNVRHEYERNGERYRFFKWAQQAFEGLNIVPPGMGIVHQIHLERLARVVDTKVENGQEVAFPEFVLGGDSHTPMVNGLGVLAWGVGGVEAEAAILGQPYIVPVPKIVGVRLVGALREGTTTTDLVLTVTQRLRELGVVGAIVEFVGDGYASLGVPDRATIANMAPEYGATAAFFPVDDNTITYLRQTGRDPAQVELVDAYCKAAGFYCRVDNPEPDYDDVVEIDLSAVEASVAGPKRPQDRLPLSAVADNFRDLLATPPDQGGFGLDRAHRERPYPIAAGGREWRLRHGALAIAAIAACTNTSNPAVMLAAGLLAQKAVAAGLSVPAYVKTSMTPGSRIVGLYLESTGLMASLESLGFHIAAFGCATCSGKSGPLAAPLAAAVDGEGLLAAAVVSSNRNFEGRIHRQVRAAYLASPPLVVAYALAGRIDIDLANAPLGTGADGKPVYLHDIWPTPAEVDALIDQSRDPAVYRTVYEKLFDGTEQWQSLDAPGGMAFSWQADSTYILEPPFFAEEQLRSDGVIADCIDHARVLGIFGDSMTTDHVAPAGEIPEDSEAGRYLREAGVAPTAFNAYTMRRGNHHVLMRGTFANVRTVNLLLPDRPGGFTRKFPEGTAMPVFRAAQAYRAEGVPLIVIGGRDYGMGSSRDWAAKGPYLLGVRVVIAESFERIHRSNLIALGIVPLTFAEGESCASLGLDGSESFTLTGLRSGIEKGTGVSVIAEVDGGGKRIAFQAVPALLSPIEVETLQTGGIFARVYLALIEDAPAVADAGSLGTYDGCAFQP